MTFEEQLDRLVDDYKREPRNKVLISFAFLRESATAETGKKISAERLRNVIRAWNDGNLSSADETIYDGAVACCASVARRCFGEPEDEDVDYSISWIENTDGSFSAELRPS